jgi:flagellar basal body-associated protein FliL
MEDAGTRELVMVLVVTAVLLVPGVLAVYFFVRQYRREQKEKERRK